MPDSDYKQRDAQSYDDVAGAFDDLADLYTLPVAEALARAVAPAKRKLIYDMGCGTGIVARAAAAAGPKTKVVGIDLSDGMLKTARERARSAGLDGRVSFVKADASATGLPEGAADAYVSLYAYSHLPDPDSAAVEAFRLLAPGGRIAVAVGSGPPLLSAAGVARVASHAAGLLARRRGMERSAGSNLVNLVREHLRTTDEEMIATWASEVRNPVSRLKRMIGAAGFTDLAGDWTGRVFVIPTVEEFWTLETTLSTWSRKFMARATPEELGRLKAAYWDECSSVLNRGGRLVYWIGAGIVTARKP